MSPSAAAPASIDKDGEIAWAAVDWGTSNLRVWIMSTDNQIIHSLQSDAGMGALAPSEFESALLNLLAPFLSAPYLSDTSLPVLCCGMVGAKQGWSDAGYIDTPADPTNTVKAHRVSTIDKRISVSILPGVKQLEPADVMRGEETQIAGFLYAEPLYDGTLCLPGTHTKWVQIKQGVIAGFQTCMSGELFSLLSNNSVLRHSVQGDGWSDDAFEQAVLNTLKMPENFSSQLFTIRAESLVHGLGNHKLRARLSGLLIGSELASTSHYWSTQRVGILGDPFITGLYERALVLAGVQSHRIDAGNATLAGLIAQYRVLNEPRA